MSELFQTLRDSIAHRRISAGIACLEQHRELLDTLTSATPGAAAIIGCAAQWIDIGFDSPALLPRLVARIPRECRGGLPLSEYAHLRLAEGLMADYAEDTALAVQHFRVVLSVTDDVPDPALASVAHFWTGRSQRRSGLYDEAHRSTQAAVDLARRAGYHEMAAVMRVLESWICFQKGRNAEATRILREAEETLASTDDYVTLGNIHSAYGRIAQREGRYDQALAHYARSVEEYVRRDPEHGSLARALANMAFVERLCAQQTRRKLDRDVSRRRTADRTVDKQRLEQLQHSAFEHLDRALAIFRKKVLRRGEGNVHSIRGCLHLDRGELDLAEQEAERAFALGQEKNDHILAARGRVLQCTVENVKLEEGIYEDPEPHARRAFQYAMEGMEHAARTENTRLIARAHIWKGFTLCNDFFHNIAAARECCDRASELIKSSGHDYLWDDLQALREKITGEGSVDSRLREWSLGHVHGKTFQQVEEEFAEIVIPRVWEHEGRKISRVAERLSVSPKKVRRILSHLGLLSGRDEEAEGEDE